MATRLSRRWWAANSTASHVDPSSSSPSLSTTKTRAGLRSRLAASAMPEAIGSPWPSEPVETSTPGTPVLVACPQSRPPSRGLAEPRDVGLEVHDLMGPVRNGAEPQGQGRIDEVADRFHDVADGHAAAAAEVEDAVEGRRRRGFHHRPRRILHEEIVPL